MFWECSVGSLISLIYCDIYNLTRRFSSKISELTQGLAVSSRLTWNSLSLFTSKVVSEKGELSDVRDWAASRPAFVFDRSPTVYRKMKDKELQENFGGLSSQYLSTRRLKLSLLLKTVVDAELVLTNCPNLSYKALVNVVIWFSIVGDAVFKRLWDLGLFVNDKTLIKLGSELSSYVKRYGEESEVKTSVAEINCLAGYMTEDESWDVDEECVKLAHGGTERQVGWMDRFNKQLSVLISRNPNICDRDKVSLEEYTKTGMWLTGGSASIGKVEYEYNGKVGHFKARKNMLLEIFTPEEIWQRVSNWGGSIECKPVVKNELGKIRLAIASNLESYIHESYLMFVYGHDYIHWDYITLDESLKQEYTRIYDTQALLSEGKVCLPWDFAAFDHQVRTGEIQAILLAMKARSPISTHAIWDKVIASYSKATITDTSGDRIPITGGLPSGQRITSLAGNVWNTIITTIAIEDASKAYGKLIIPKVGVKGDDTYIIVNHIREAYFIRLAYASLNAQGNNAKFSVRDTSYEFLRTSVYADKVVGWGNRAIPAITQRKPWGDEPWDPIYEVNVIADNIRNVGRRFKVVMLDVHLANKIQWSKFTRQSYKWLELPRRMGGLGCYKWSGLVPDGKLSLAHSQNPVLITNSVSAAPHYLGLDEHESVRFSNSRIKGMMRSSDCRDLGKAMADIAVTEIRRTKVKWEHSWDTSLSSLIEVPVIFYEPRYGTWPEKKLPIVSLKSVDPEWPSFMEFLSDYPHYRYARTSRAKSLMEITREKYPLVARCVKYNERLGYHRSDAIDLVLGNIPIEPLHHINPRLAVFIQDLIDRSGVMRRFRGRERIARVIYNATRAAESALVNSQLNRNTQY